MDISFVDHIIYCAHDLDEATDYIEGLLGIRPIFGGQHPNAGSHNALLSLGDGCYLEIITKDPNQPDPTTRKRSFDLDNLVKPALRTWAAGATNLTERIAAAAAQGYDAGTAINGGRAQPDGTQLKWRSAKRPEPLVGDGLVPFLIEWGETPHPSGATPQGCRLVELRAEHPDPESIRPKLAALATPINVTKADQVQLIALIESPNGLVELR